MEAVREGGREIEDHILIKKILAGNDHAFRLLVSKYQSELYKTVYAVLRNQKDAEDVTQEAFVKIYRSLPQYENQGFKTWMKRIAVNQAIDLKRKKGRQQEEHMEYDISLPAHESVEDILFTKERSRLVRQRLEELPTNYRNVVYDFYIEEKSYQQMADEQEIPVKTIEMKLYRARQWMKKHWKEDDFS